MTDKEDMTDDERLSAWLDGELPRSEAKRIEERLSAEPALARRLERLREAEREVQHAFHAIDATPMPQAVLDMLKNHQADRSQEARGAQVVRLRSRVPRFFQMPVAIAASIALVAGFLVHDLIAPQGAGDDVTLPVSGLVAANSGLHRALETAHAAEPVRLANGRNVEVVLTFQAENGDWCRQFLMGTEASAMHGLACRQPDGWRLETASFAAPGPPDAAFQPAAGATPAALEAAVRGRLGGGEPLGRDDEIRVISGGWDKAR